MRKKIIAFLMTFAMVLAFVTFNTGKDVKAASASLTGTSTARAGDTISLTLSIAAQGSYGLEGNLSYNSGQVTFLGANIAKGGWKLEMNGNKIVAYDDALSSPTGGNDAIITMSFKVNSGVAAGTGIGISVTDLVASNGNTESALGTASYSLTVAAPLSGNCDLASLTVGNASLSPAFSASNTSYSCGEVDFSISSLSVNAAASDGKSRVSVVNNSLAVGGNTVSVVVTAENGATKTYTISVTRKQDPNYVASSNATLAGISLSVGTLSPTFNADTDSYIVYLPYENRSIEISGTAADGKAQGVAGSNSAALEEGNNELTVTCTAEDGSTKTYTVNVFVMPEFNGGIPVIEGVKEKETEPPTTIEEKETTTEEITTTTVEEEEEVPDTTESTGIPLWALIVAIVVALGAGAGITYFIIKKKVDKNDRFLD